jgi:hypothetical protein
VQTPVVAKRAFFKKMEVGELKGREVPVVRDFTKVLETTKD